MSVLILHSSRFGQSEKIAEAIANQLADCGLGVETAPISKTTDLTGYSALVVIASVRYGFFSGHLGKLAKHHCTWLATHPTLLVTVSLTARTAEKRDPAVHSYTKKFLDNTPWKPSKVEVVAGALRYPEYNFFDRKAIQLIMRITGGVTDPTANIEYTDWEQVAIASQDFAKFIQSKTI